jgi:hypothetical protein
MPLPFQNPVSPSVGARFAELGDGDNTAPAVEDDGGLHAH